MSGKRGLSDDEIKAWTSVTRSIKPLKVTRRVKSKLESETKSESKSESTPPAVSPRKAAPKPAMPKPQPALAKRAAAPISVSTLSRREKQRASRGHDAIDARLDLHGHTQSEAHAALSRFLRRASANEMKLLLVVTGKSGVLRQQVPHWLSTPELRGLVISTSAAAINHGGDGALYIRVRRGRG